MEPDQPGGPERPYNSSEWRPTPKWHWRSWLGYVWMRDRHRYTGNELAYRTERQRAREILQEQFDPDSSLLPYRPRGYSAE